MFDGGDCLGPNPRIGFDDGDDESMHHYSWDGGDTCNGVCLDNWLADECMQFKL